MNHIERCHGLLSVIVIYDQNQLFKLQDIKTVLIFIITNSLCLLTDNPKTFPRLFSESLIQEMRCVNAQNLLRDNGPCSFVLYKDPMSRTLV